MWGTSENGILVSLLWWLNVSGVVTHFGSIVGIVATIYDARPYDTYQLIVPINGTPYVSEPTQFNAQGALSTVHSITFIAHVLYLLYFNKYVTYTENTNRTPYRWLEYSITAPLMILTIGTLCGVRDRAALMSMAGLVFAVIVCGAIMQAAPPSAMPVCALAFVLLTIAFLQLWISYSQYSDAPKFVSAIIFTMSLLFYSFGFVPLYAYLFNKSILFEECCQTGLSSTSKILLTGLAIPGILQST